MVNQDPYIEEFRCAALPAPETPFPSTIIDHKRTLFATNEHCLTQLIAIEHKWKTALFHHRILLLEMGE